MPEHDELTRRSDDRNYLPAFLAVVMLVLVMAAVAGVVQRQHDAREEERREEINDLRDWEPCGEPPPGRTWWMGPNGTCVAR